MSRGTTIVFLMCYVVLAKTQYEGDDCGNNGVNGTCVLLKNCQSVINDVKNEQPPQMCSFRGMDTVVCCVDSTPPKPTGTTPRPSVLTTSTQRPKSTSEYMPPVSDYMFVDPNIKSQDGCEPIASNLTSSRTGQKAWDKCIEYQEKLVYPCVKGSSLSGENARVYRCNHNSNDLIINGVHATRAEFSHMVILKKFSDSECASLFPPARLMENGFDSKTQICYGDKDKPKDTCQGDSGGPLQLKNKKIHCMYTVVGVTSFRKACGYIGEPGIYTKVSAYVPWIESVVWP